MAFFHREFIIYNGIEVPRGLPGDIIRAQAVEHYTVDGVAWPRIRYGSEFGFQSDWTRACGDCAVAVGQFHLDHCDIEQCARCRQQALTCPCDYAEWDEKPARLALP